MRKALFVALALSVAAPAHATGDLYARIEARLTADPALAARLGKPSPELTLLAWMIGAWDVVAQVQAGGKPRKPEHGTSIVSLAMNGTWLEIRDSYPGGTQDVGFLGYNPATKRWISLALDSTGNAVTTTGTGWQETTLTLSGDALIVGERTTLRQILTRLSDRAYTITNTERAADGTWRVLDVYKYTKKS